MKKQIQFIIPGIPKPKQSARFRVIGSGKKSFIRSYQSKEVKDNEANIGYTVMAQLPNDFILFDCPIFASIEYIFPVPSSFSKKLKAQIVSGERIYKATKPDISDNLNKGLIDALQGIVFVDDSRISRIAAEKYYGMVPKTIIKFEAL